MAINTISAHLDAEKNLVFTQDASVNLGENYSVDLVVSVPSALSDYNFNLEFSLPDGKVYATGYLPLLKTADAYLLTYSPDRSLLAKRGRVYIQVCGRKELDDGSTEVFKSNYSADASFFVNPGVYKADPYVPHDTLTDLIQAVSTAQAIAEQIKQNAENGLYNGKDGTYPDFSTSTTTLAAGEQATVTKSGTSANPVLNFGIPRGDKGEKGDKGDVGVGISDFVKTGSDQLTDTYTVYFTNGNTFSFTVTNGSKGEKGDVGNNGADGNGIVSISKSGENGITDTYTISFSNGTESYFTVTNGEKGDKGDTGEKGEKGDKGNMGISGNDGITFTPSIDENGNLIWTRSDDGAEVPSPTPVIPHIGEDHNWYLGTVNLEVSAQGEKGEKGEDGANGLSGADGANGVTFIPSIDSAGNLSWTNDGGLTNPDTINIKGLPGKDGVSGTNVLYVVPDTAFINDDDSLNNSINSTLIISEVTVDPNWRVGDNAIVPYYNTTCEANRILGGEILDLDADNNSVSIYLKWFIN
ncbi:MAG: hypothetical protein ACI4M0_04360 [Christensenellales bacterium]